MNRRMIALLVGVTGLTLMMIAYTQLTFFVIQPIGAVPEGRTVVIWRRDSTEFIDSADAFCERRLGKVNLLCRAGALAVIGNNPDGIIARLPYSRTLYLISTNGAEYDR